MIATTQAGTSSLRTRQAIPKTSRAKATSVVIVPMTFAAETRNDQIAWITFTGLSDYLRLHSPASGPKPLSVPNWNVRSFAFFGTSKDTYPTRLSPDRIFRQTNSGL